MAALTSAEEPPYLTVGTDVSAKFKGAFCEAKITNVERIVKLRVLFKGSTTPQVIDGDQIKDEQGEIKIGAKIEARHPAKPNQFSQATISKITDHSRYTVIFDDGDSSILRRNSLRLKSGRHFAESETLDRLPLTNPEHFGNPVKVEPGAAPRNSDSTNTVANATEINNSSTVVNVPTVANTSAVANVKAAPSDKSNTSDSGDTDTERPVKPVVNRKLKRPRGELDSGTETANCSDASICIGDNSISLTPSLSKRRSIRAGRRRRDSSHETPRKTSDAPTEDNDNDLDEIEKNDSKSSSNSDLDAIEVGTRLRVMYCDKVYGAKVLKKESHRTRFRYYVHYLGWNNRYDEWIRRDRIVSIVTEDSAKRRRIAAEPTKDVTVQHDSVPSIEDSTNYPDSIVESESTQKPPDEPVEKQKQEPTPKDEPVVDETPQEEIPQEQETEQQVVLEEPAHDQVSIESEPALPSSPPNTRSVDSNLDPPQSPVKTSDSQDQTVSEPSASPSSNDSVVRSQWKYKPIEISSFREPVDEVDCEKKIAILEDRLHTLRGIYVAIKSKLSHLERRQKRGRQQHSLRC